MAIALTAQVSAWTAQDYLEARAARGDWQRARDVLAKAPDVESATHDGLD